MMLANRNRVNLLGALSRGIGTYKDFFVETYGCQMNVADSQLIGSILTRAGFSPAEDASHAGTVIFNTCAVRQHAEDRVIKKISELRMGVHRKGLIGLVGCMSKRYGTPEQCSKLGINFVVGPDCYRKLPEIVQSAAKLAEVDSDGRTQFEGKIRTSDDLCLTHNLPNETYSDVYPRAFEAFSVPCASISIARGCNNMCSYCVVPYARGKERSRSAESILAEFRECVGKLGAKQVTLLGQNVNSYADRGDPNGRVIKFAELLGMLAREAPDVRLRFMSPHPKDFPTPLLDTIASYPNICKQIHLPLQSGSNTVLQRMRRNYTREKYMALVDEIRTKIPGAGIGTDIICGFCGETEEEFRETLDLVQRVRFDSVSCVYSRYRHTPSPSRCARARWHTER